MTGQVSDAATGDYRETLHWAIARDGFESVVTVFNYLGWAFPDRQAVETDAEVTLRFFAEEGRELAPHRRDLQTGKSLHVPVGNLHPGFRGMVAVRMAPKGMMPRKSAGPSGGRPIATSFFMLYERKGGFRDFSHELFLLRDDPGGTAEWATIVYMNGENKASIVVMNNRSPASGEPGAAEPVVRLYDMKGQSIASEYRFALPPGGSRLVSLSEAFPDMAATAGQSCIATVSSRNIEQPMTMHIHRNGDFNVHHF